MGEERWEKLAAATGIVFVVLVIAGSFIAGQPPKADDPINKIDPDGLEEGPTYCDIYPYDHICIPLSYELW